MRRELVFSICTVALIFSTAIGANEDSLDSEKKRMSDYMMSLGPLKGIQDQMTRDGRSDAELRSALVQAFKSLASCTVDAVVAQANRQGLPATLVLGMMSGIYEGPDDAESMNETETIQSFDFDAFNAARRTCNEKFMDDVG